MPLELKQCVIPIAGLGTRMFPASRAVPKALFPVVDGDGRARPLVHVLAAQAVDAGIERVGLVLQEEQLALLKAYFERPVSPFLLSGQEWREEADRIADLGSKIEWIVQEEPRGFGDAVLRAQAFVGGLPFLVMLGDHLFLSRGKDSCVSQMANAFRLCRRSVIACCWVEPEALNRTAAVAVKRGIDPSAVGEGSLLDAARVEEKPGPEWIRREPSSTLKGHQALGAFGMDVFTEDVFSLLEELSQDSRAEGNELRLRDAQDRLAKNADLSALVMTGNRYDLGEPELYAMHLAVLAPFERSGTPRHGLPPEVR